MPLIGLMIAIIVGMVGLSVDVGNTFSEERRAVTAANTAALAGMNAYIGRSEGTTNRIVYQAIVNSLNAHGVQVTAPGAEPQRDELTLQALYLDAQGRPITTGSPFITPDTNPLPNNVSFIQVNLRGRVDTTFARVVGRNDLPINAMAHAGVCSSNSGVYPITVSSRVIDGNRFINPNNPDQNWREVDYDSPDISGRFTAMRVIVSGATTPGNFSWLRWRDSIPDATSEPRLAASLTGEGNLGEGFEEAPWPTPQDRPATYPEQPGVLNVGDWVWGATGYMNSNDVRNALDEHIRVGTRMVLPIHSGYVLQGNNSRFHIVRLGLFVLLDKGQTRNDKWLDLLFLGDARPQQRACLYTGVIDPNTEGVVELVGSVSLWPEYAHRPQARRPIQYVVVLDVSGSMSADFEGRCDRTTRSAGRPGEEAGHAAGQQRGWWRCAEAPPNSNPPRAEVTGTGPEYWWSVEADRRITVAKRALYTLVRSTNMPGNAEYDPSRPPDTMALVWYNHEVPSSFTRGFSSNPTTIIQNIDAAGALNGDRYRTSGGTNSAGALYRASLVLNNAPRTVTQNGRTWEYKRAVVFVTDGVANQFMDRNAVQGNLLAGQSRAETYAPGHFCRSLGTLVIENAACQTTDVGGLSTGGGGVRAGLDRPITQAVRVSREDIQANGTEVYVVALSHIPDTGLRDGVASFPSYFFSARDLQRNADGSTNVDAIMQAINIMVETGLCEPRSDAAWTNVIPASNFQAINGLQYPVVGAVTLVDQSTGTTYTAPIRADASRGGALSYRFDRLPAGSYRLVARLFYRHSLDLPRVGPREYGLIYQNEETVSDIVINVAPNTSVGAFTQTMRQDLQLRILEDVCRTS
ncbi:MAG: pilus assembly protein TadG-related protein [Oscillochloridaceae bacterium]|nr:pilus assembly protein TadG-related protein [Chloroflexaceae bacterium]MDW8388978.1 pilus assembly protein TadG-related protein [Oscillochloridaceae bacterium]